ncbi:MAG: tripartite tricarboxylate transporter family receptor [Hyphomicrobiales bacterium]|nr:tripartite tricarboxylate transporter family receptor [Hyphomicrobiales bacterium]
MVSAGRIIRQARRRFLLAAAGLLVVTAGAGAALAQDFYRGKQVTLVVSADVGNSYDMFARMIGRHLPRFIPGEPSVIVQNMPGAGGLRAANWLYNVAPKDGLTIGMINNTLAFDPLYGNQQAQFDAAKFNWLGTPSQETALLIVWHTVPVNTLADAKSRELILSATGAGSTPAFFARVLSALFDLKVKIIPGYKSQTAGFLAMEQGENDGNASPFWSSLSSEFPHWLKEKKIRPLVYYGAGRNPEIPAPHALDLLEDPEKRAIMEIAQAGLAMGRPLTAPPGVDPEKVTLLRAALMQLFKDPAYLEECRKASLNCSTPSGGEDMLAFVRRIYDSPKSAVQKISAIYMQGQQK